MYSNQIGLGYAEKACDVQGVDFNPTVGENLEARIDQLEKELARLKASRESLGPLLSMRIRDIRDAMSF